MTATATACATTYVASTRTRTLGVLLAVATVPAALPTLVVSGLLHGPPVMNGSARGTALVMLVVAVPVLLTGLVTVGGGSVRGWALLTGAAAYLTYNAALLTYATPFNAAFLAYVALLGLAFWSLVSALVDALPGPRPGPRLPARGIAGFIAGVVVLNTAAWLARIVPDLFEHPPGFLAGTGMSTNPVYVQDLALWLPALAVVAVLLARRRPGGVLLAGAGLVFWQVEAMGVAVDQWLGHLAAPASDVATLAGAALFVVVSAVTAVPLTLWWRAVGGSGLGD